MFPNSTLVAWRRPGGADSIAAMLKSLLTVALLFACAASAAAADAEIRLAYLTQRIERPPVLANLRPPPEDEGLQGARLGIADNATSGKFLKQRFTLDEVVMPPDGDVAVALRMLAGQGHRLVIADLPAATLDAALATPEAAAMLLFNTAVADDRFRGVDCRANLLHTLPSRAMLADALAQVLVKKKWPRWFLVVGPRPEDRLYADALRRAAKRFGGKVVAEKTWSDSFDLRRSAADEVPVFTQGPAYDVLIVADELGDFGDHLAYQTWDPRPVAGTQGLVPAAWHAVMEQWGAMQLQSRFEARAKRPMMARDYAAWVAVRSVGEAAARTRSDDPAAIAAQLRSPDFELAAFKGRKVSFRTWDGQLRQPIPLATARALVATAPLDGFLHATNEMDTLGMDAPESACKMGRKG